MNQRGFAPIIIILGIVLILGIAGGAYYVSNNTKQYSMGVVDPASIEKAKKLNEESKKIAEEKADETANPDSIGANWKTYTNSKYNYSIKYPLDYSLVEVTPDYIRIFQGSNEPNALKSETYLSVQLNTISFKDTKLIYKTTIDGKTLVITPVLMGTEDSDKQKVQSIFDQITATFKFLDQNQNAEIMIIKGKIVDFNDKPFINPDVTINSVDSIDKCTTDSEGNFICNVKLVKGKSYGIYFNNKQNDSTFALQYFSGDPGQTLDLGIRKAPR